MMKNALAPVAMPRLTRKYSPSVSPAAIRAEPSAAGKALHLAALSNRVLELTPEGPHQFGGGYTEYVARTGQEAPGLRI